MRYQFDKYCLDSERRELACGPRRVKVAPKTFSVLLHLVSNRHRMVSKSELLDEFWPPNVSESVLQTTIRLTRQAVGDNGRDQKLIRTYHGQGFRFVAVIAEDQSQSYENEPQPASKVPGLKEPSVSDFEERRLATVLACRFKSSELVQDDTESGDDPEMHYLKHARQIIAAHEGILLHIMPDGFTALFGAARGFESGRRRATECAKVLVNEAAELALADAGTTLGIGIDRGRFPIVTKNEDAPFRALPSEVLKTALLLADEAGPGQIVLSAQLDKERNKGAGFKAFPGRRAEQSLLQDRFQRVEQGQGQAVLLLGQAGIGKSRLLRECLKRLDNPDLYLLEQECLPLTRNTPLSIFSQICREICGDADGFEAKYQDDALDRKLLEDLLNPNRASGMALSELSPHMRRKQTFALIAKLVARQARACVLTLVIEDIHWMDATSRDCLIHILQQIENLPVFLLLTARPVPDLNFAEWLPLTVLQLAPLNQKDCVDLVKSKPGLSGLSDADARLLASRAAGNPFFLEELSMAVEAGSAADGGLPDTVQAIIAARFDGLDADPRSLLQAASVVGPVAPVALISELLEWDGNRFEAAYCELLSSYVLVEDTLLNQPALRFRHILLQEAAYEMLARNERETLHRKIARSIRKTGTDLQPERLAWHFQEAGKTALAVDQWTQAARRAHQKSASREAIEFARNGLKLFSPEDTDIQSVHKQLDLQLILAPALAATMGYGSRAVGSAYQTARNLSRRASTPRSEFRMLVGLWNYNWVRGNLTQALKLAKELLMLARVEKDPSLELRALACMGEILFHTGNFAAAHANLEQACAIYDQLNEANAASQASAVACHSYAAWSASFLGQSDETRLYSQKAGLIAYELVQPFSLSLYYALNALVCLNEGDTAGCLEMARNGRKTSERGGFPFWHGTSLVAEGWAEAHLGDTVKGLASLQEGIRIFEGTGARIQLANWFGLLAEVHVLSDDVAAARKALDTATSWADATGDVFFKHRLTRTEQALADME